MKTRNTHIRKRRFYAATLAFALCLAWFGPVYATCACCASMSDSTEVADAKAESPVPSCHAVPEKSDPKESSTHNPIQLKAPCEDNCSDEIAPDSPESEIVAVVNHASGSVVPMAITTASIQSIIATPTPVQRDTSPPGLLALSTARYASSAPHLT